MDIYSEQDVTQIALSGTTIAEITDDCVRVPRPLSHQEAAALLHALLKRTRGLRPPWDDALTHAYPVQTGLPDRWRDAVDTILSVVILVAEDRPF